MEEAMALNIKNEEAHRLAQALADATGQSMTQAVTNALRQALEKEKRQSKPMLEQLEQIALHCAALPVIDNRPTEDILSYDEFGLPFS